MLFTLSTTAFAESSEQPYNFTYADFNFAVEYVMNGSSVTEKITIHEERSTPIILEKIVTSDGNITVYQNGIQTASLSGGDYRQYVSVAQGQKYPYLADTSKSSTSTYSTYPCGYNIPHAYISRNQHTVSISANNAAASIVASLVGALLHPVAGAALGTIIALVQLAMDKGADYIDVSETKYFVHGAYANDMNCYHAHYTYYNLTSTGSKSVIGDKSVYTQELV